MSVVFDKLSFMRHLESEGTFARPQAEKLSDAFHNAVRETVATRADIVRLEATIDAKLTQGDAKLTQGDAKLAQVDAKLAGADVKIAGVDARIAGVEGRMGTLEAKVGASLAQMKVWIAGAAVALFIALPAARFFGH